MRMAVRVQEEYNQDKKTMQEWLDQLEAAMTLAKLTKAAKTFPWPDASNVKLMDLNSAVMKWAAKSYTKLLSGTDWAKAEMPGLTHPEDVQPEVDARGERLAKYLNYQLQHQMDGWEDDFDRFLHMLPWAGCLHKKTYYDPTEQRNISELVLPEELVINQGTKTLDRGRVHQKVKFDGNEYRELVAMGLYLPVAPVDEDKNFLESDGVRHFIECHGWYDLDGDGYKEPYIMTLHEASSQIVRVLPRYMPQDIQWGPQGVISIKAEQLFIKYGQYPAPDGSYWDVGWGHLASPLVEACNALLNQLIDAGTMANLGAGVVDVNLRLKDGGSWRFEPGEWKRVKNQLPGPLRDAFHDIPTPEPSQVTFAALELLLAKIQDLAVSPEVVSESLPANAPVGTTLAKLDEAEKVNNAVDKRIYRSMSDEFRRLYTLNGRYGDPLHYAKVLNIPIQDPNQASQLWQMDHTQDEMDVMPTANPETSSRMMRLAQADYAVSQGERLMAMGARVNPDGLYEESLEAAGAERIERFISEPTPEEIEAAEDAQEDEELMRALMTEQAAAQLEGQQLENAKTAAEIETEAKEPEHTEAKIEKLEADAKRPAPKPTQAK